MADQADDALRVELTYDGKKYVFVPEAHLTAGVLRQVKQWYGLELGRYLTFIQAMMVGDPDAVACAIWAVRKANGEPLVEPNQMEDFAVGQSYRVMGDKEGREAPPTVDPGTPTLTGTPTLSDGTTSSTSPTSAD